MRVTLFTSPDCPLCDEVKHDLCELQDSLGFALTEVNILDDASAYERFKYLIPVVDIEGGELLLPPHDWLRLTRALQAAGKMADGTRPR